MTPLKKYNANIRKLVETLGFDLRRSTALSHCEPKYLNGRYSKRGYTKGVKATVRVIYYINLKHKDNKFGIETMSLGYFESENIIEIGFNTKHFRHIRKVFPVDVFREELNKMVKMLSVFKPSNPLEMYLDYYKLNSGLSENELMFHVNVIKALNTSKAEQQKIVDEKENDIKVINKIAKESSKTISKEISEVDEEIDKLNKELDKLINKKKKLMEKKETKVNETRKNNGYFTHLKLKNDGIKAISKLHEEMTNKLKSIKHTVTEDDYNKLVNILLEDGVGVE